MAKTYVFEVAIDPSAMTTPLPTAPHLLPSLI